ncbi:MAG: diguanylate cyclase [Firmicutes bacterium]|nr:diguanylate cyclase [Bacillota bacterium]
MRQVEGKPILIQVFTVIISAVAITILITMLGTLGLTLSQNKQAMDRNLLNSARVIARVPILAQDLEAGAPTEQLWEFLDNSIAEIGDIDTIAVADVNNIQYYYPDKSLIGEPYVGEVQQRILNGGAAFTSDDTGVSGAERCAYAPVVAEDGTILGFVMVGIYIRSISESLMITVLSFLLIALATGAFGAVLAAKLSDDIKSKLMGYEPDDFLGLFHQREDILEALEEGVLAIDETAHLIYINQAAAKMLGLKREAAIGRNLYDVYPDSTLGRILTSKRSEHNVPLRFLEGEHVISDRIPIREDGRVIGVVEIMRNMTEVTRLAKDLTGVRHMVEAMRAYTHEFMNKLHVILGLLQLGKPDKAEEYIKDVTRIQQRAVGAIMNSIEPASVAALLVGKTSRCAELGIRLVLGPDSSLSEEEKILPADACVTVLGNLIENAIDALNSSVTDVKEITVSIQEELGTSLLICVEDTGSGMEPQVVKNIFQWGFSTKSRNRGTGLSMVHDVVTAYQGEIRVESDVGMGTRFYITFRRGPGKESSYV